MNVKIRLALLLVMYTGMLWAQPAESGVRVDQIGFYPLAPKMAVVTINPAGDREFAATAGDRGQDNFYILSADGKDTVFTGILGPVSASANSSLHTRMADFSSLKAPGSYVAWVPGAGRSYPFRIADDVMEPVAIAVLKGYYYQRSAMPLEPAYAGQWSRPAGHPDTQVLIHPSAASEGRPAGTIVASSGGWYDAGDYNKYIVNSGITMGTLLAAYEDFPGFFDTLRTNIPPLVRAGAVASSGGGSAVPDILNESIYNLRWMLTMQDPGDGGVYNKCTNAAFDGMVMPGVTKAPRYVVQKGTAATLDFAAVMAQASRILKKFDRQLPGLGDSCLRAATRAWQWALGHPYMAYDQDVMNKTFDPKVITGGYGDRDFRDEWWWAAVELWISTGDGLYKKVISEHINDPVRLPSWANVYMMGVYTLFRYRNALPGGWNPGIGMLREKVLQMADQYCGKAPSNAFHTAMGGSPADFVWGSNSVAANQGMVLINAWLLTRDRKYMDNALGNLDYLMGRNATGYCFVTGMGSYSPLHPHHRPSIADGIIPPVPGLLVGGPNPGRQDHQLYTHTEPETAYADQDGAYASNEIAINWNAPMVYLTGAIEALRYQAGYAAQPRIVSIRRNP